MKSSRNILLSFAAPLLVILAILGFFQREGREKVHALPALLVGGGLIFASALRKNHRRKMLLNKLITIQEEEI